MDSIPWNWMDSLYIFPRRRKVLLATPRTSICRRTLWSRLLASSLLHSRKLVQQTSVGLQRSILERLLTSLLTKRWTWKEKWDSTIRSLNRPNIQWLLASWHLQISQRPCWTWGMEMVIQYINFLLCIFPPTLLIHRPVINGCISVPIAILAYFFLPDTPGTAKANWLFSERVSEHLYLSKQWVATDNTQEIELAKERMLRVGRIPEGKPYNVKVILGYLTSWKTLLFTLTFGILIWSYFSMLC